MDDLYTERAANQQPAPAGYGGMWHRKLAGADDLYHARAANRQPAQGLCWLSGGGTCSCCRRGSPLVRRPPPGSRLRPAEGGCAKPQATGTAATLPLNPTTIPAGEPITSPVRDAHTSAALDKTPPPLG